jgi:hypothetical protein
VSVLRQRSGEGGGAGPWRIIDLSIKQPRAARGGGGAAAAARRRRRGGGGAAAAAAARRRRAHARASAHNAMAAGHGIAPLTAPRGRIGL